MLKELLARFISEMKACFYTDEAYRAEPRYLFGHWYTKNGIYAGNTYRQAQQKQFLEDLS